MNNKFVKKNLRHKSSDSLSDVSVFPFLPLPLVEWLDDKLLFVFDSDDEHVERELDISSLICGSKMTNSGRIFDVRLPFKRGTSPPINSK